MLKKLLFSFLINNLEIKCILLRNTVDWRIELFNEMKSNDLSSCGHLERHIAWIEYKTDANDEIIAERW